MKQLLAFLLILFSIVAIGQQNPVGIFEGHTDVGTSVKPGSATYIPETGQYVISGAGYNVWADHDEFQFVWKKMKGDFIISTRAEFLGNWVNYHRKVGVMVRKITGWQFSPCKYSGTWGWSYFPPISQNSRSSDGRNQIQTDQGQYYRTGKARESVHYAGGNIWRTVCNGYDK